VLVAWHPEVTAKSNRYGNGCRIQAYNGRRNSGEAGGEEPVRQNWCTVEVPEMVRAPVKGIAGKERRGRAARQVPRADASARPVEVE